jgi:hypothetical protein
VWRVVVAITLVLGTAHADPERAKQLSAEADALVASGDLLGAAAKFRAAYKEEPRPDHMCNSGVAYHKAKDLPRSHRYLNLCVSMGGSLDPAYRENLRKVVDSIEQKLVAGDFTPIDIAVEPQAAVLTIEGGKPYDEEIVGGGRIWVPYGAYRFIVRAPGFVEHRAEVTANKHAAIPLRVTLEKQIEKPVEKPVERPIEKPIEPVVTPHRTPSKLPAIVATSATGAFAIASLVFYVRARGFNDDAADPSNTRAEFVDLRDKATSNQRISWVLGGVAGAGAVVSGILWWRFLRTPTTIEVTSTSTGGAGVAIRGRF